MSSLYNIKKIKKIRVIRKYKYVQVELASKAQTLEIIRKRLGFNYFTFKDLKIAFQYFNINIKSNTLMKRLSRLCYGGWINCVRKNRLRLYILSKKSKNYIKNNIRGFLDEKGKLMRKALS